MAESQPQMAGGTIEIRDEKHLFPMLGATTVVLLIAVCDLGRAAVRFSHRR